jgi:hypothetical protein
MSYPHDADPDAPPTGATRLAFLAAGIGAAAGLAAMVTHVAWPPIAALVAGCVFLGFVAPRHAWPLGLLAGLVVAALHGAAAVSGVPVPAHFGVLGHFGAVLPALAGAYLGQMAAALATRLRGNARTVAS